MTSLDDLSDDALLRAFEDGTLPPGAFHHRDHVRTAWALLEQRPVLEALSVFRPACAACRGRGQAPACTTRRSPGPTCCSSTSGGRGRRGGLARVRGPQSRPPGLEASVLESRYYRRGDVVVGACARDLRLPNRPSQLEPDVSSKW